MRSISNSTNSSNVHSPPLKRYLVTMLCAAIGASVALYISTLENKSIEKATLKTHLEHKGLNVSKSDLKEQLKRMKAFRKRAKHSGLDSVMNRTTKIVRIQPGTRIALIGERHTGTRWIMSQLQHCFPNNRVTSRLTRWKHLFQDDYVENNVPTLVIALFRHPYLWLEAMRKVPHNAPNHFGLEWKDFLKKEWTIERPERDLGKENETCYENFSYNEVVPCIQGTHKDKDIQLHSQQMRTNLRSSGLFVGYKPVYELKRDKSGNPYSDILEFRAAKINNFLQVENWDWVKTLITAQYEILLKNGTDSLISQIETVLNVTKSCSFNTNYFKPVFKRNITQGFIDYVNQHIDWETEKKIGYHKHEWIDDEQIINEEKEEEDEQSNNDVNASEVGTDDFELPSIDKHDNQDLTNDHEEKGENEQSNNEDNIASEKKTGDF